MCASSETGSDSCTFNTNKDFFYIQVVGYNTLKSVTLNINVENAFSVSEVNVTKTVTVTKTISKLIYF